MKQSKATSLQGFHGKVIEKELYILQTHFPNFLFTRDSAMGFRMHIVTGVLNRYALSPPCFPGCSGEKIRLG
jgi:hypothetical protein